MLKPNERQNLETITTLERRIGTVEKVLANLLKNNYLIKKPSGEQIDEFRAETLAELQGSTQLRPHKSKILPGTIRSRCE
jgi:hypothetical protein